MAAGERLRLHRLRRCGPLRSLLMPRFLILMLLVAACSPAATPTTTETPVTPPPESTSTTVAETTTTTRPVECAKPPYRVDSLPERVEPTIVDPMDLDRNPYLEVAGTSVSFWLDGDGDVAVALIRGTLPLEDWPGDKGEVFIDGARAVAGPFDDGSWVVAWFEEPGDRCDLFTMVFYPPVEPSEVQATLASMDRTAG
jgi:hypothetical protein